MSICAYIRICFFKQFLPCTNKKMCHNCESDDGVIMFINRNNSLGKVLYITLCYVFINAFFIHLKTESLNHHCSDPICCSICLNVHTINADCQTPIPPNEINASQFAFNSIDLYINSDYSIEKTAQTLVSVKVKKTE